MPRRAEPIDGFRRRGTPVPHTEAGEKPAYVQGNLRIDACEPGREGVHLFLRIVLAGDDQGGHLHVAAGRGQGNRLLHGVQIPAQQGVVALRETLQVDVHGVDLRQEGKERLPADGAVGDRHGL